MGLFSTRVGIISERILAANPRPTRPQRLIGLGRLSARPARLDRGDACLLGPPTSMQRNNPAHTLVLGGKAMVMCLVPGGDASFPLTLPASLEIAPERGNHTQNLADVRDLAENQGVTSLRRGTSGLDRNPHPGGRIRK